MTRILQISDPHLMPEGALFQGRVDTAQALREMLSGLAGRAVPSDRPNADPTMPLASIDHVIHATRNFETKRENDSPKRKGEPYFACHLNVTKED